MDRLQMTRRLPIALATLSLLALPMMGCGSDTKTTVEVPTPPTVVVDAPPATGFMPTPEPGTPPGTDTEPAAKFDSAVSQTVVDMKHDAQADAKDAKQEVRQAEGEIKKAVEETEDEAKKKAQEIEAKARKSAEEALEKLLPEPK